MPHAVESISMKKHFVDTVEVQATGGAGGNGCMSFRREAYVPLGGPDGGDGGTGGDVIFQASQHVESLISLFYSPRIAAQPGGHGKGKQIRGKTGENTVHRVPLGTEVRDAETDEIIADLVNDGDSTVVAHGGAGGLGNVHWKTNTDRAPREHTPGEPGEEKTARLILKTVADVGLVGFPNAGKSSLLAKISHAHPVVAPYPFTTLHPVIGTILFDDFISMRAVDVPGIIEGAHKGVGLGVSFLRHIERAKLLIFILDMAGTDVRSPLEDYRCLVKEVSLYKPELAERQQIIVANKMDIPEAEENLREFRKKTKKRPIPISTISGSGIDKLIAALHKIAVKKPRPD